MEHYTNRNRIDNILYRLFCVLFFLLPVATSPAVAVGGILLLIWVFSGRPWKNISVYRHEPWVLPALLLLLLPYVGLVYTIDLHSGLGVLKKSYYWLFAFALFSLDVPAEKSRRLLDFFLLGISVTFIVSMLQHLGVVPLHRDVTATGYINHIVYSLYLVFSVLVLSFYFKNAKSRVSRAAYLCLIIAFAAGVGLALSRIGHMALICTSPIVLINLMDKKRAVFAIAGAAVVAGLLLMSPVVRQRIEYARSDIKQYAMGNPNSPVGVRLHMWKGAVTIFLDHPILGAGTGSYALAMQRVDEICKPGWHGHPHNSFLYMAASYGIVGLSLLIWFCWSLLLKGWRYRARAEGFALLAYAIVLVIGSLTDTQILAFSTGVMASLMAGFRVDDSLLEQ